MRILLVSFALSLVALFAGCKCDKCRSSPSGQDAHPVVRCPDCTCCPGCPCPAEPCKCEGCSCCCRK